MGTSILKIDANGLSCPEPVILLKKAITSHNEITLLVDNQTSVATCGRYAESKGYSAEVSRADGGYVLEIKKRT